MVRNKRFRLDVGHLIQAACLALFCLLTAPRDVRSLPGSPQQALCDSDRGQRAGTAALPTWATWDELTEDSIADDPIYVCILSNTTAGGDEVGLGSTVNAANRTLTETGTVTGAVGDPYWRRKLDGTSDWFDYTPQLWNDMIVSEPAWTYCLKIKTFSTVPDCTLAYAYNAANGHLLRIATISRAVRFYLTNTRGTTYKTTVGKLAASTTYYIMLWSAAGEQARGGFSATKPTRLSDFDADNRVAIGFQGDFNTNFATAIGTLEIGRWAGTGTPGGYYNGYVHYFLLASDCLIDNAS